MRFSAVFLYCIKAMLFALVLCFVSVNAFACADNQMQYRDECIDADFTIKTIPMNSNESFKFYIGAAGVFYVDCGEGGDVNTIADTVNGNIYHVWKLDFSDNTSGAALPVECKYTNSGEHII